MIVVCINNFLFRDSPSVERLREVILFTVDQLVSDYFESNGDNELQEQKVSHVCARESWFFGNYVLERGVWKEDCRGLKQAPRGFKEGENGADGLIEKESDISFEVMRVTSRSIARCSAAFTLCVHFSLLHYLFNCSSHRAQVKAAYFVTTVCCVSGWRLWCSNQWR